MAVSLLGVHTFIFITLVEITITNFADEEAERPASKLKNLVRRTFVQLHGLVKMQCFSPESQQSQ